MKKKIIALAAASLMLGACQSTPQPVVPDGEWRDINANKVQKPQVIRYPVQVTLQKFSANDLRRIRKAMLRLPNSSWKLVGETRGFEQIVRFTSPLDKRKLEAEFELILRKDLRLSFSMKRTAVGFMARKNKSGGSSSVTPPKPTTPDRKTWEKPIRDAGSGDQNWQSLGGSALGAND